MPIYCAVHLWTSPTALTDERLRKQFAPQTVAFDTKSLRFLPLSVCIAYILPLLLMALPSPDVISYDQRQIVIATWQAFPIWVTLSQLVLGRTYPAPKEIPSTKILLDRAYIFTVSATLMINIMTVALTGVAYRFQWGTFSNETMWQRVVSVFVATPLAETVSLGTLGKGCLSLLQYDMYFACGASVLWVLSLYRAVDNGKISLISVLKLFGACVILGPGGASVLVMWRRDDHLLKLAEKRANE
jgi:hypothetical protein